MDRHRPCHNGVKHYESFSMKEEEFVDNMFGRLQVILNSLEALGYTFTKAQINRFYTTFPRCGNQKQ
ncbi:hypothetical protein GmHk_07G020390 [Glycine max]|nr:hypothetical protein GmHk_07G020390 [Glycine max]